MLQFALADLSKNYDNITLFMTMIKAECLRKYGGKNSLSHQSHCVVKLDLKSAFLTWAQVSLKASAPRSASEVTISSGRGGAAKDIYCAAAS
ncbi:jg17770 [Pararge aegeria aegeria]|uniref:Jg17770 protein n=1 Tax=Pararge aegeria aegeria TaxID=348720 RepID=A0A8S4RC98_9NEOP|nr:jg17770 [Pararge aegeria aegeria]